MRNTLASMTPGARFPESDRTATAGFRNPRFGTDGARRGYKEAFWGWLGEGFDRHGAFHDALGDGSPDLSDFGA